MHEARGEQMTRAWANVETRAQNAIHEGEKDKVNPWLERTQWLPYLVGMERSELLACIEEPVAEPDPRQEQQAEPVEAAIWAAMEGLARFSQASVIHQIGGFVRLEAIRTEMHQTRILPLQPYMDEKSIGEHARPWQQMLMFFARTQREHAWRSPKYRFTRRQREAWEALVEEAERSVEREEEGNGADDEEMEDEEIEDEEMSATPLLLSANSAARSDRCVPSTVPKTQASPLQRLACNVLRKQSAKALITTACFLFRLTRGSDTHPNKLYYLRQSATMYPPCASFLHAWRR
jgi:hypothetical protein